MLGLDNFNDYYDVSLKRARQTVLQLAGVDVLEGDVADARLLRHLLAPCAFTHIIHLAAQARRSL